MTAQFIIESTSVFGEKFQSPQIFKTQEHAMQIAEVMIETGMERAHRAVIESVQIATIKKTGRYSYGIDQYVTEPMETRPRI